MCVRGWGGVGQTARNRGNRGHGVSAEIKKKHRERKPLCKLQRDDVERVGEKGDGGLLACLGSRICRIKTWTLVQEGRNKNTLARGLIK